MAEPTEPRGENTPAIFGFFCGLIAIPTAFIIAGILFGAMAVALGRLGLQRSQREGRHRLSWAAIILGVTGILIGISVLVD